VAGMLAGSCVLGQVPTLGMSEHMGFWAIIGVVAVFAIVFGNIANIMKVRERERTRREVAAYIAEGSMTPEQGERLLKAGRKMDGCG